MGSPCRTLSGSAWVAAPSSSSPTSSSPSDSPNTSAPSATGSCERRAGTGGTWGRGDTGMGEVDSSLTIPCALLFSFAVPQAQRRPVPSTSPVSRHSSSRAGLCWMPCPRSSHKPVPSSPGVPTNPCQSAAGLQVPLSPLRALDLSDISFSMSFGVWCPSQVWSTQRFGVPHGLSTRRDAPGARLIPAGRGGSPGSPPSSHTPQEWAPTAAPQQFLTPETPRQCGAH